MTPTMGSVSGAISRVQRDGRFSLLEPPPRAEVRAAAADSVLLGVACLISYWLTTWILSLGYSVSREDRRRVASRVSCPSESRSLPGVRAVLG
jgi:hypothetical protein